MNPILSIKNLEIALNQNILVSDVSFNVYPGEILALIGPNGAGKTTILKAILGLIDYQGEISVCGNINDYRSYHIGYVPQRFVFDRNFPIKVDEFLKFATSESDAEIDKVMTHFDVTSLKHKLLGNLSGGELQKVLLVRAIIKKPCLILLDEATTGIDPEGVEEFSNLIRKVRDEYATSIIFVSHEIDLVYKFADRAIGINRSLIYDGPVAESLSPNNLKNIYKGDVGLINKHSHRHD